MTTADKAPVTRSTRPGYELVAEKIVELISTSRLQPGNRLPTERALAEQLGVSRTVIREAVKLLSATGVVRVQQGSGLYVSDEPNPISPAKIDLSMSVEPHEVMNLFEFRMTIEMQTARLAAERITPREIRLLQEHCEKNRYHAENDQSLFHESDTAFHLTIAEATRNPYYASAVAAIHHQQHWVTQIVIGGTPGSRIVAVDEHYAIWNAIKDGLLDEAVQAMKQHIETVIDSYQQEVRRRLQVGVSKNEKLV